MKVIYYEIAETPSTNVTAKQFMHVWNPFALTVVSTKNKPMERGNLIGLGYLQIKTSPYHCAFHY